MILLDEKNSLEFQVGDNNDTIVSSDSIELELGFYSSLFYKMYCIALLYNNYYDLHTGYDIWIHQNDFDFGSVSLFWRKIFILDSSKAVVYFTSFTFFVHECSHKLRYRRETKEEMKENPTKRMLNVLQSFVFDRIISVA